MALLIKTLHEDQGLQGLFHIDGSQEGEVQVHRDEVTAQITYPFIFLSEATESTDLIDSESIVAPFGGGGPPGIPATRVEMLQVHVIAFAAGGDLPWAILQRIRQLLVDEGTSPYFQGSGTSSGQYDIRVVPANGSRQNLLPTLLKDEKARKVYQSTQTFLLHTKKLGG